MNTTPTPTHYYTSPAGNQYRHGKDCGGLLSLNHWRSNQPLLVTVTQTGEKNWRERRPLVMLDTILGAGAHYSPETLRALAATLQRIAADAEAHPMGPRSFWNSDRGYDVAP